MAIETHVFFRGCMPSIAALSRAMRELGFPISIPKAKGSLDQHSGFLPMKLDGEETGVEIDIVQDRDAIAEFANRGVSHAYERMASFRWGGDIHEAAAGLCSAAALAKLTNGVVFDESEGKLLSVLDAVASAQQLLASLPAPGGTQPRGTRPTDIKHYLKPLLRQRDDLFLSGRMLVIRPVRHILRGAFLDRTSDKYRFNIWRYVKPLYGHPDGLGLGDNLSAVWCPTWHPHFTSIFLDSLQEDVFDHVGQITSLSDLARTLEGTERSLYNHTYHRAAAILLGEGPARAAAFVDGFEAQFGPDGWPLREMRALLERDFASVCAVAHANEAETVKALKLDKFWEPSPFPAELPEARRIPECNEKAFSAAPWIAKPSWLIETPSDLPSKIRFAEFGHRRKGKLVPIIPLSRDEAEKKHQSRENYVAIGRLPEGQEWMARYWSDWSPHDPERSKNPNYVPRWTVHVWIYGMSMILFSSFSEEFEQPHQIEMRSIDIRDPLKIRDVWNIYNSFRENEKSIWDHRNGSHSRESRRLTTSDLIQRKFPIPAFGDTEEFVMRIKTCLRDEGYGPIPS